MNDNREYNLEKGGYFVVIDVRHRIPEDSVEADHNALRNIASLLRCKNFIIERFNSGVYRTEIDEKALRKQNFTTFLQDVATHATNNKDETSFLVLVVLAECENVESDTPFRFHENYRGTRVDYMLTDILKPFLACHCEGLKDKPKLVMIHATESVRDQPSVDKNNPRAVPINDLEDYFIPSTNHADFYISVSRPKVTNARCYEIGTNEKQINNVIYNLKALQVTEKPVLYFIHIFNLILENYPIYEINQVMAVMHREMLKFNQGGDENEKPFLRLWNSSRLCKKLYLRGRLNYTINVVSGDMVLGD